MNPVSDDVERTCSLCGSPDPLDLAVCLECSSRTGDGLVFASQSVSAHERQGMTERLHSLLPPGVDWEAFDLAARGHLPLARVPLSAAEHVLGAFAHRDIATHIIPRRWGVAPLPRSMSAVLFAVVVVGSFVGLASGHLIFLGSPLYAGLLWILAQIRLRRPAACAPTHKSWLPPDVERRVIAALAALPVGSPRTLLSDAVRLGAILRKRAESSGDEDLVEDTVELLALAADAATEMARIEQTRRVLRRHAQNPSSNGTETRALEAIEASHRHLHGLLLDAVQAMGGAHRRLPEASARTPDVVHLAEQIERSRSAHAAALSEVEGLLT